MMKRVCNSRFAKSALLLAVVLLVSGVGAPVWGRENISAGQSGDPTDGEGISSTGGATSETAGTNRTVDQLRPAESPAVILVVNGVVIHLSVRMFLDRWKLK